MNVTKSLLLLFTIYLCSKVNCDTIRFRKCGNDGFTCLLKNSRYYLTYNCPSTVNGPVIYINSFGPTNTVSITIENCTELTLSIGCTMDKRAIENLVVRNIKTLIIPKTAYAHIPNNVNFTNITLLENIPENTFVQVDPTNHKSLCQIPKNNIIETILFDNVTIGTISSNAFSRLSNIKQFEWNNVNVERLQVNAIKMNLNRRDGFFLIQNSTLEVLEHLAIQIVGKNATFRHNKFVDISSSGINGTVEIFKFSNNLVNNLQSYSISVLSKLVTIANNNFEYLSSGAFARISPGLLEDSWKNFALLNFEYNFTKNFINRMDPGSLDPDMKSYKNVANKMHVNDNKLYCTCENVGWFLSDHFSTLPYYLMMLNRTNNNFCTYSCNLPFSDIRGMITNGKCNKNLTLEQICRLGSESTTIVPGGIDDNFFIPNDVEVYDKSTGCSISQLHISLIVLFQLFIIL